MTDIARTLLGILRAAFLAGIATAFVCVPTGAESLGWLVVGWLNALSCVWGLPRLVGLIRRYALGQLRMAPDVMDEGWAALVILPGLAILVGSHPSLGWRVTYLVIGLLGGFVLGWRWTKGP